MELRVLPVNGAKAMGACLVVMATACGAGSELSAQPASKPPVAAAREIEAPTEPVGPPSVASAVAPSTQASAAPTSPEPDEQAGVQPPTSDATNASLSTEAARETPPELPRGTTVLHIGDSFAGALGIELNREFKDAGVRGILKYETATYIPTWAWGKELEKYLSKYHPDLVMITLGANELEITDPASRAPTIRHLVERLGGRPCVWVAPPLWHGARPALLDVIRSSCAPCAYLDSSALVPELARARDGIHPAMAARKEWARAVVDWLALHRRSTDEQPWRLISE